MQTKKTKKSANRVIICIMTMLFSILSTGMHAQNTMTREHLPARKTVTQDRLRTQISHLCDSLMEGRGSGTKGNALAAVYLQREFEKTGLLRFGDSYASPLYLGPGKIGRNIIGMLPGSKNFTRDRYVIVGAHYDNLGVLDGNTYPGADSNASGVTAMLNIAGMMTAFRNLGKSHDSNVIFVAFDGKEHNMAGSKALWRLIENGWLTDPQSGKKITRDKIALMVNIDQIGCTLSPLKSGRKDYIIMLGSNSLKPIKRDMLGICNRMFAIDMEIDLTYYGSRNFTQMFYRLSDQRTFIDNGIPAVLFTSGITMNTNKTRDTEDTIDYEILQKRIFLIYHWLDKML